MIAVSIEQLNLIVGIDIPEMGKVKIVNKVSDA